MSIRLQKSFCESDTWRLASSKALRAINARWALPVYPVFEDEKSNGSDQKSHKKERPQDYYNCYKLRLKAIKKLSPSTLGSVHGFGNSTTLR